MDYNEFIRKADDIKAHYNAAHGHEPGSTDYFHQAWRLLKEFSNWGSYERIVAEIYRDAGKTPPGTVVTPPIEPVPSPTTPTVNGMKPVLPYRSELSYEGPTNIQFAPWMPWILDTKGEERFQLEMRHYKQSNGGKNTHISIYIGGKYDRWGPHDFKGNANKLADFLQRIREEFLLRTILVATPWYETVLSASFIKDYWDRTINANVIKNTDLVLLGHEWNRWHTPMHQEDIAKDASQRFPNTPKFLSFTPEQDRGSGSHSGINGPEPDIWDGFNNFWPHHINDLGFTGLMFQHSRSSLTGNGDKAVHRLMQIASVYNREANQGLPNNHTAFSFNGGRKPPLKISMHVSGYEMGAEHSLKDKEKFREWAGYSRNVGRRQVNEIPGVRSTGEGR